MFGFFEKILPLWSLDCCFSISSLESWSWLFLNLDSLRLDSWSLILWNLLNSWFFGIIKVTLEDIASTISPFFMMTILKSREYMQFCSTVHSSLSPPFFLNLCLILKFWKNIIYWFLKITIFLSPFGNIKKVKVRKSYKI